MDSETSSPFQKQVEEEERTSRQVAKITLLCLWEMIILYYLMNQVQLRSRTNTQGTTTQTNNNNLSLLRRQLIIALLKESGNLRRPFKEVNELIPLIQEEPFFQPLANNFRVLSEVCQKVELARLAKDAVVYRTKSAGDYFYILLSGTVHLTINEEIEPELKEDQQTPSPDRHRDGSDSFSSFLQMRNPIHRAVTEPSLPETLEVYEKIVKIIEEGDCFGEMMEEQSIRSTNAVAVQECYALKLNKRTYATLLKDQLKTENYSRFCFLQELPMFNQVGSFALSQICLLMQEQQLIYGQFLYRSGDTIEKIYLIRTGSFKLMKRIGRTSLSGTASKIEHKIVADPSRNAEYLIVQEGEVLGQCETLSMQGRYLQTCVCESQEGSVLSIDKKMLFKILIEDESSFPAVRAVIGEKDRRKSRMSRSFLERRTRNSVMNIFLTDHKLDSSAKRREATRGLLQREVGNSSFFYNELNKSIADNATGLSKNRFSLSKHKCETESDSSKSKNVFAIRNKKKEGVPHAIDDIVKLVRQKVAFQRRFRKENKKIKCLFQFNADAVPLYVKSRFNRV